MKITIPMASRGRPQGLLSVLTALDALATGNHTITYVLLIDDDDALTAKYVHQWFHAGLLPRMTYIRSADRSRTVAARINEACEAFPADVYCPLPDDGYPLAQHWDGIFQGMREMPAFAWLEVNAPGDATFIAVSERWRAATGRILPDYFPFWFADTWIAEVHYLAFAKGIGIVNQMPMGGKRGVTRGMRDLEFWFRFFAAKRAERIEEAAKVAKAWGFTLREDEREAQLKTLAEGDAWQKDRISVYAQKYAPPDEEPSEAYKRAKTAAEAFMAERGE